MLGDGIHYRKVSHPTSTDIFKSFCISALNPREGLRTTRTNATKEKLMREIK